MRDGQTRYNGSQEVEVLEQPSEIERAKQTQRQSERKSTLTDARPRVTDRQEVFQTAELTSSNLTPPRNRKLDLYSKLFNNPVS